MSSDSILNSKPHQKFKIFIVDDDPFSLNYYTEQFHRIGCFDVSAFLSGEECLNHLGEKPDVVFLDFHLATLSGIETLWKIKSYDHNIYVIILSAEEQATVIDLSLNLGAFDFFIKGKTDTNKFESALQQIQQISNELSRKVG
jgi:response regulator of citrate/malate metabolism